MMTDPLILGIGAGVAVAAGVLVVTAIKRHKKNQKLKEKRAAEAEAARKEPTISEPVRKANLKAQRDTENYATPGCRYPDPSVDRSLTGSKADEWARRRAESEALRLRLRDEDEDRRRRQRLEDDQSAMSLSNPASPLNLTSPAYHPSPSESCSSRSSSSSGGYYGGSSSSSSSSSYDSSSSDSGGSSCD